MNLLIFNLASVPAVRLLVLRISAEVNVCDKRKAHVSSTYTEYRSFLWLQ